MKAYIIEQPQLQSVLARVSEIVVACLCWLMWLYFLSPVVWLGKWLLDGFTIEQFEQFGGYTRLTELLHNYVLVLCAQAVSWLLWVYLRAYRKRRFLPVNCHSVEDSELAHYFHVDLATLQSARDVVTLTVYFDEQGEITQLQAEPLEVLAIKESVAVCSLLK